MVSPFVRAALAAFFISSFAMALSVDEVAQFYLNSGESMKLESITVQSKQYSIVKVDGKPSLVLASSGSTYAPLVERADLEPVVKAYVQKVYESKDFKKSAALLNESLPLFENVLGSCDRGGAIFTVNFPRRSIRVGKANVGLKYLIDNTQAYKNEKDAYTAFNAAYPGFHDAYAAFMPKVQSFGALVTAGDSDAVLETASVIRTSASALKTKYGEVTAAYRSLSSSKELGGILNFTFYDEGEPRRCNPDANTTTALSRIENEFSDNALVSSSTLVSDISTFTAARSSSAQKGIDYAVREEEFKTAETKTANVSVQFAGQGYTLELKTLATQKEALRVSLTQIKSNGSAATFDEELEKLNEAVSKHLSAVASFKSAAAAIKNATENVTSAKKKYGETDNRVQALNSELNSIKTNMSAAIAFLSSGDTVKASAQFLALTQQSVDLASRAGTLQTKGNELDLPVIGGVVLLVLILAGTVWYFRKMKSQQPKLGSE